jgi:hypothetical protein
MDVMPLGNSDGLLAQIQEGATVYDRDNAKVGTVKQVYLGGEDLSESMISSDSVLYDVPQSLRSRLAASGFVEISTGFFSANRYATSDQVAAATGERVELSVGQDDLVKK